jgi:hypothetical protein
MSPLRFSTKADTPPNLCMECGVQCRRPKRFCSDDHKQEWLDRKIAREYPPPPGTPSLAEQRKQLGISQESLDWRRKLSLSRPF